MEIRLLAYSHDTVGLGHLRRTVRVCAGLVNAWPRLTATIVTGAPLPEAVALPPGVDYVKLPSVRKLDNERYEPRELRLPFADLCRMRAGILSATEAAFDPDMMLVDKCPLGLRGELRSALDARRARGAPCVLGLRDILDDPASVRAEWSAGDLWRAVERYYDAVWIYGDPSVFDAVRAYGFPAEVVRRTRYVGYFAPSLDSSAIEELRESLGLGTRRLLVATAGGGEDGFGLLDAYVSGLEERRGARDALHVIVCGPAMPPEDQRRLRQRAARLGALVLRGTDRPLELFAAADGVVTMGGYNTLMELVALGRPTVVVPRVAPRTEQLLRAERLAARGLVRLLRPHHLSPAALHGALREEIERSRPASGLPFTADEAIREELRGLLPRETASASVRLRAGRTWGDAMTTDTP